MIGRADRATILTTSFLLLAGLIALYSASAPFSLRHFGSDLHMLVRQLAAAGAGCVALFVFARLDYHLLLQLNEVILFGATALSCVTLLPLPICVGGCWLSFGAFDLQPTEFVKLALILYLSASIARRGGRMARFGEGVAPYLLILGVLGAITMSQPDLGMLLVYAGITLTMLFLGGASLRHLAAIGLASLPLVYVAVRIAPYRFARLLSFLNPTAYSTSSGYQVLQSLVAVGSGGLLGRGLGASRAKLFYLPQAHNDFILSIVGEELGLLGTVAALSLLGLLVWRAFVIAEAARDAEGRLIAYGIGVSIGLQTLLNAGVILGILPVTGLTLPFFSNGGTSLLLTLAMVGVLLNVSRQGGTR
ncbi:MAG: putative lipid II flippase FtsW [Candidatus Bipolaricaulota bacterium]